MKIAISVIVSIAFLALNSLVSAHGQVTQQAPLLELDAPIERELAGGETHQYHLRLSAGEYARVEAEQTGIKVFLALLGEKQERLNERDAPVAPGPNVVEAFAERDASFVVTVSPWDAKAPVGRYRIRLAEKRPATQADKDRYAAEVTSAEAGALYNRQDSASWQQAIEKARTAAALWHALGKRNREGGMLHLIGLIYWGRADYQQAREYFERAGIGDIPLFEVERLRNLANVHLAIGEYQQALDVLERGRQVSRESGDEFSMTPILLSLGRAYFRMGEPLKALEFYQQALAGARARRGNAASSSYERSALFALGQVYYRLGDDRQSLAHFGEALPMYSAVGGHVNAANTLTEMGNVYRRMGEHQKALDHYLEALRIKREKGAGFIATEFNRLGQLYLAMGRFEDAHALFTEALVSAEAQQNVLIKSTALIGLARLASAQGNLTEALPRIEQAVAIREGQRTRVVSPDLRASFFAVNSEAYDLYIDLLMRLSQQRHLGEHMANQNMAGEYMAAALHVVERARARSLLGLLGESAAQLLQSTSAGDPQFAARERDLQNRIESKANEQSQLFSGKPAPEAQEKVARELTLMLAELDQVRAEIKQRNPRYAALTSPEPLKLSEIQKQVLDENTLLLEYALGKERSYLFAVTPAAIHGFVLPGREEIETKARRFYRLLTERGKPGVFRSAVENRQWLARNDQECAVAAMDLSQVLLGPAAELLGKKRLLIVGYGILHYVPFAALPSPATARQRERGRERESRRSSVPPSLRPSVSSSPLIVNHEIVALPSASVLAVLRREFAGRAVAPKTIAVLADPVFVKEDERLQDSRLLAGRGADQVKAQDGLAQLRGTIMDDPDMRATLTRLPFTRTEAESVIALVPESERKVAFGFEASRALATGAELSQYRYVHFATHGLLDNTHPELSGLVFSLFDQRGEQQNGFLRATDIFNLRLPAELVVLSGCRTALGKEVGGEGLVGLTHGFMYAGAKRVMASLWPVSDAATAELMRRFYKEMLGERHLSPAAALRAAQVSMSRDQRWRSPFYWAAFTLQGEW